MPPLSADDLAGVIADAIKAANAPLLARIAVLEAKGFPTAIVGEKGERGADGKDAPPVTRDQIAEAILAMPDVLQQTVSDYLAAHPPNDGKDGIDGRDGKDAEVDLDAIALQAAALVPTPKDGTSVTVADVAPVIAEEVRSAVAALPVPRDGEPGPPVDPALVDALVKDQVAHAVAALPAPKDGTSVTVDDVAPLIASEVEKAVKAIPIPKDGVGVAGALINKDDALVLTLSDGSIRDLGLVVGRDGEKGDRGEPGANGIDGRDGTLENLMVSFDGKRTLTLSFKDGTPIEGGVIKLVGLTRYEGIWSSEKSYEMGDQVTRDGSQWTAKADSIGKQPGTNDGAAFWQLSVKRGDAGKVGPVGPKGDKGLDGKHGIDLRRS